jgi:hypothetical protein
MALPLLALPLEKKKKKKKKDKLLLTGMTDTDS